MSTISRDQFKRLCEQVLKDAPAILKDRDKSDKAMDRKSALLKALYTRLREKLGLPDEGKGIETRGFKTYEFAYREAIYRLALDHAKEYFDYQRVVNDFLDRALKH